MKVAPLSLVTQPLLQESKYTKPVSALRLETVGAALPSRLMVTLSSEFVDSHMMIVSCKLAFFH